MKKVTEMQKSSCLSEEIRWVEPPKRYLLKKQSCAEWANQPFSLSDLREISYTLRKRRRYQKSVCLIQYGNSPAVLNFPYIVCHQRLTFENQPSALVPNYKDLRDMKIFTKIQGVSIDGILIAKKGRETQSDLVTTGEGYNPELKELCTRNF